jgi:tRNA G37 N-methylase TrmD
MTTRYEIIDEIITEMLGEPDPALGGYVLDRGNLQAFADRVLWAVVDSRKKQ